MEESLGDIVDEIKESNIHSKRVQKKRTRIMKRDNIKIIIKNLFQNLFEH